MKGSKWTGKRKIALESVLDRDHNQPEFSRILQVSLGP